MHPMTRRLSLVALIPALTLSACGSPDGTASGDGPAIVTSLYPLEFVAERVAGDHAKVENLTQPGGEPHDLELTGRQVGQIADADLVIYLRGLQPSVDQAVDQNAHNSVIDTAELVDVLDSATDKHGDEEEHHHDSIDPHIWLDPANMETIARAVAERLSEADPDNAGGYQRNAEALVTDLDTLDQEFDTGLAQCQRDVFVTAHEAFGYLAHRYGLQQIGISGIDPDAEPSPRRLAEVHDIVEAAGVTTIFYERLVSPTVAETLADDLGVQAAVLDPIEGLTDATADQDYLSLMRANLEALQAANGCP